MPIMLSIDDGRNSVTSLPRQRRRLSTPCRPGTPTNHRKIHNNHNGRWQWWNCLFYHVL